MLPFMMNIAVGAFLKRAGRPWRSLYDHHLSNLLILGLRGTDLVKKIISNSLRILARTFCREYQIGRGEILLNK